MNERSGSIGASPVVGSVPLSVPLGEHFDLKPKMTSRTVCGPVVPATSKQIPLPLFVKPQ